MGRRRLDAELVRRGLVESPTEAEEAVRAGRVLVRGAPATKTTTLVARDEPLALSEPARPFVSRGGRKLVAALDAFAIDPDGRDALDAGASTGGFTDVLLQRGARHVVAVDVGSGQLAWELRTDPRVTVLERTNVRDLRPEALPYRPSIVTVDLSFISLRLVLGALIAAAAEEADVVSLIKPQFEAGREEVGHGGVVRDPNVWRRVLERVMDAANQEGAGPAGLIPSPIRGPAGNVEFLIHAVVGAPGAILDLDGVILAAEEVA